MLPAPSYDTVAVTDLAAYTDNLRAIRDFVGKRVRLMAVVKANAYGHGAVPCGKAAIRTGADMLGVAFASEGAELRSVGIEAPILVMGQEAFDHLATVIEHDLTASLVSPEMLAALRLRLEGTGRSCRVHVKVDTGMGRVGVRHDLAADLVLRAMDTPGVTVTGLFTHFPAADIPNDDATRRQIDIFRGIVDDLERRGSRPPLVHMCNSAGTLNYPEAHFDLIRPGIMTYGLDPFPGSDDMLPLRPVLSLKSRVAFVKDVPEGMPVSYGRTFVTARPSRLATVPTGYSHGFQRLLSNRGNALIYGRRVPIAGRVCMDQTVFDVTDVGNVRVGDEIVLIGADGDKRITAEEHAELAETINYEIVVGITDRVSRITLPSA